MCKAIYLDMDGTITDTYSVQDWEPKLRAYDPSPYSEAKPMYNMRILNTILEEIAAKGITIGVISWLAMDSTKEYDKQVRKAKKDWLAQHLPAATEIHLIKYGYSKKKAAKIKDSILIDDNPKVREAWKGETIDATGNILIKLLEILEQVSKITN